MKMKKTIAITLACAMALSGTGNLPKKAKAATGYNLKNPTTDSNGVSTWDCIYFGNYWQNDTNGDGKADQNDAKQPIKWRVLSVNGDDAFILADQNLDAKPYNQTYTNVTWENCTIRSWLNGYGASANKDGKDFTSNNFIDNAFSTAEQKAIKTTDVVNEDNPYDRTDGGNDTEDKIYLLAISEASNAGYGFVDRYKAQTKTRETKNTEYVNASGVWNSGGNGIWWLRTPGHDSFGASHVHVDGYGNFDYDGVNETLGVRPSLHLNFSSSNLWKYAGTVSSEGNSTLDDSTTVVPIEKPTSTKEPVNVKKGSVINDAKTEASYKVLSVKASSMTVEYLKPKNKKVKNVSIEAQITYKDKKYKIVKVADEAFMNCKKLKKVVVGKNVRTIGKKAFANCRALETVWLPKELKNSKIAEDAFSGCTKKLKIKVLK